MTIDDLDGKNVCIAGFGREGQAALRAIRKYAPDARVTVADKRDDLVIEGCDIRSGEGYASDLDDFDVVIKSPGIPPSTEFDDLGDKLTNSTDIFLHTAKKGGAQVIGVTGSKGKSTTASLLHQLLKRGKTNVHLVGNIGEPALDHLEDIEEGVRMVIEMSSYQLMQCTTSPHVAVVTSFFPEHLDYHGSMEAYKDAKKQITRFQTENDIVFYAEGSQDVEDIATAGVSPAMIISKNESPVTSEEIKLLGEHNLSNIALACAAAWHVDDSISVEDCIDVCRSFEGLPHRLQLVSERHGIRWIDDAISTTPDSTIAGLKSLGDVHTVIMGGQSRGVPFDDLGRYVASSSVREVILFPDTGAAIRAAIEAHGGTQSFHEASTMQEAVDTAKRITPVGNTCLLSTASPSYNLFKDFEEKGNQFAMQIAKE